MQNNMQYIILFVHICLSVHRLILEVYIRSEQNWLLTACSNKSGEAFCLYHAQVLPRREIKKRKGKKKDSKTIQERKK